jgi:prepilin-type N-terminal cleavage/methylation domain-containing protein
MRKNNRKGFTIVELVIVIAVIAILAGVLIPTFAGITKKAEQSAALQEARNLYTEYLSAKNGEVEDTVYLKVDDFYFEVKNNQINEKPVDAKDLVAGTVIVTEVTESGATTETAPAASAEEKVQG